MVRDPRFKPSRYPIFPAAGGGPHFPLAKKAIRLSRFGCGNRPFYHIVVHMARRHQHDYCIDQLGTFDPLPNVYGERLVSLNIERLRYWLSHRTKMSKPVARLLGLSGFLPMHPSVIIRAWHNRINMLKEKAEEALQQEEDEKNAETEGKSTSKHEETL